MTIGEYIKLTDIEMWYKLTKHLQNEMHRSKDIKLGDSIENLMKHDSYRKVRGRIRQRN